MCNLSWTPHSSPEKDNSLNHLGTVLALVWAVWSIHLTKTKISTGRGGGHISIILNVRLVQYVITNIWNVSTEMLYLKKPA